MTTDLLPHTTIREICGHRDAAQTKMREAIALIARGHEMAGEAQKIAARAHGQATFHLKDRSGDSVFRRIFEPFDADASVSIYRKHLDARVWMNLVLLTGVDRMMDRTAKDALYDDLCGDVPEVTEENARSTFKALAGDARLIFQRGIARAFGELDRRFKSHDGFKIGSRIILTNVFDAWGMWNYHSRMQETLTDIERVFVVLDGKQGSYDKTRDAIAKSREGGHLCPRQSVTETPYFKIRTFKNGNAHLWFIRDDLVKLVNLELAAYYGEVLPDAAPKSDGPADIHSKGGLPAKNLGFYPTPEVVTRRILNDTYLNSDSRVLEPSAGTGHMVRTLLETGASVDAIEISPDRVRALESIGNPRLRVTTANFLQRRATPDYTHVIMNPPFYGTHWMEHVTHAFDFLAPGGTLVAILPITAELGQSKKHIAFRKWAKNHTGWGNGFNDLPAESFASSGTRINTVYLTLHKGR